MKIGTMAVAAVMLSGCVLFDGTRRAGPDEFGVVSRAPLSQPPDFSLRPPRTGAERPNEVTPRDQARSRLLTRTSQSTAGQTPNGQNGNGINVQIQNGPSSGEQELLKLAGANNVDPDIRVLVNRESGRVTEDESIVDKLVFWRTASKGNEVVDAKKEAERLNRKSALGEPPVPGKDKKGASPK
jgi:Protein of unknown function (DUF3035)